MHFFATVEKMIVDLTITNATPDSNSTVLTELLYRALRLTRLTANTAPLFPGVDFSIANTRNTLSRDFPHILKIKMPSDEWLLIEETNPRC